MTDAGLSRRRALKQICIRLALALIAAALGYLALTHALAMVIQKRSPGRAHTLAPGDGFITGELSSKLSRADATPRDRAQADQLARLALRQDPTAIDAAAAFGLNAQVRGDKPSARRLFAYVQALSRRDLQTQLWEIGDALDRHDLPAILMHYDIALRTSLDESPLLFHTLAIMIADPKFRKALAQTLARRPAWADNFLAYAVAKDSDPETMAALLHEVSHFGGAVPDRDSASVINLLIATNRPDRAWAYYAEIHTGVSRRMSRDPSFDNLAQTPSAFDWTPINHGGISAAIQPDSGRGGVLTFAAAPSIGGQVVGQIELLPPGDYSLEGRSEGIDQADDAMPYWALICADGRELGRVNVPNSTVANGVFRGLFSVPADCPVQMLAFEIQPSSDASGVTGQIDRALLRPAR